MDTPALFVCEIKPLGQIVNDWEQFRVTREFVDGENDVLAEGCYYACRSSIDRYYRHLDRQERRFRVYWASENRFEAYFFTNENGLSHAS